MSAGALLVWGLLGLMNVVQVSLVVRLRHRLPAGSASVRLVALLLALLLAAGALLMVLFATAGLTLEQHGIIMWTWLCGAVCLAGFFAAARARRMPTVEMALAVVPLLELAVGLTVFASSSEGLAAPAVRALLVAPAALGLCGYFGASLGYLLWGAGQVDLRLGYESLIGRRFLLSKASPVLSTVTTISVIGVALGVWLVLVSLGVLAGFENDLQRKIIGANAHLVLQRDDVQPFPLLPNAADALEEVPGVVATAPFLESEVAIASYTQYTGAVLFGIDPARSPGVLSVLQDLGQGSLSPLSEEMRAAGLGAADGDDDDDDEDDPGVSPHTVGEAGEFAPPAALPNIVIGVEMAKGLNVKVGDKVRLISPVLQVLTPIGPAPKSLGFRVAGIFSSKMYEYDARYAYVSLPAARRFLEAGTHDVTGLQLRCTDPERTEAVGQAALAVWRAPHVQASDWRQRNQTLFSALKLERVVAFVVLVFIILVASFSIVNTLTMSVIEKRREIAILKTMGARDVGIMKLFLVQGMLVGSFGTFIGAGLGVVTMKALERFGFWIPGEVYYIDSLPVKLEAADVVLVVLAACLIVWDFAVFPALRGSQLEPVEGLRDG